MVENVIGRLVEDQRGLRQLLNELVEHGDQDDSMRAALLQRVERELEVHARIKQELLEPALSRSGDGEEADRRLRACEENYALERMLLPDLKRTEPGTPEFSARLRMFREMLEHHAQAEEALFARARAQLPPEDLAELERRIEVQRERLR